MGSCLECSNFKQGKEWCSRHAKSVSADDSCTQCDFNRQSPYRYNHNCEICNHYRDGFSGGYCSYHRSSTQEYNGCHNFREKYNDDSAQPEVTYSSDGASSDGETVLGVFVWIFILYFIIKELIENYLHIIVPIIIIIISMLMALWYSDENRLWKIVLTLGLLFSVLAYILLRP